MNNGAKLVVVLVVIFAGAGLYMAFFPPGSPKTAPTGGASGGTNPSVPGSPRASERTGSAARDRSSTTPVGDRPGATPTNRGASDRSANSGAASNAASSTAAPLTPPINGDRTTTDGGATSTLRSAGESSTPSGGVSGSASNETRSGATPPVGDRGVSGMTSASSVPGAPGAPGVSGGTTAGASTASPAPGPSPATASALPPPPRPTTPPAPSGPREYTIIEGDTFSSIAEEYLGDARKSALIEQENPGIDPTKLAIGQKIKLPGQVAAPVSGGASSATTPSPTAPGGAASVVAAPVRSPAPGAATGAGALATDPGRHTIKQGDTLASIAERYYGTKAESAWRRIFEANRGSIGDDPARLKVGTVIVIPAKPS